MWRAMVEALLSVFTFLPVFDRSGPAAIDVSVDASGRRLLILNAGPGSARAIHITARSTAGEDDGTHIPIGNAGRIRVLRPEKWTWLEADGTRVEGEWTVKATWTEDGRPASGEFRINR